MILLGILAAVTLTVAISQARSLSKANRANLEIARLLAWKVVIALEKAFPDHKFTVSDFQELWFGSGNGSVYVHNYVQISIHDQSLYENVGVIAIPKFHVNEPILSVARNSGSLRRGEFETLYRIEESFIACTKSILYDAEQKNQSKT